jgi:antitoxin component YwqK of YwqJK toxin-antitoxin module
VCDNGVYGFEGIFYKDVAYGQSTWQYCNGKIQEQGIRFNGKEIGQWKKWNENGDIVEQIDHGNIEQIDSMPKIKVK